MANQETNKERRIQGSLECTIGCLKCAMYQNCKDNWLFVFMSKLSILNDGVSSGKLLLGNKIIMWEYSEGNRRLC